MSFQWKPYISVAQRRRNAEKHAAKLQKKGQTLTPVVTQGRTIASTFWGKAWCENLDRYSDYSNRLPRGRTYVRNGSVIDLQIGVGQVSAKVMGSDLYTIKMTITDVPQAHWQAIGKDCAGSIDSLVELLQGRFSKNVMERICLPGTGLFPSPKEIKFACSCPDWAAMCKHVAAVFYGIGARLDTQPELLFTLRKVDAKDLVARAGEGLPLPQKKPVAGRVLDDSQLSEIFGIEMADVEVKLPKSPRTKTVRNKPSAAKKTAPRKSAKPRKNARERVPRAKVTQVKKTVVKMHRHG